MVYIHLFFSKCSLIPNSDIFGSCIIHILYTGCAKIKKIIPAPKGLFFKDATRNSVYVKTNDSIRIVNEATIAQFKFLTQHFPRSEQNIGILIRYKDSAVPIIQTTN